MRLQVWQLHPARLGFSNTTFWAETRRRLVLPKHSVCPHTSPEGTVAPLQGHSEGAPVALVLFSVDPLPGFLSPSGALLHPDVHLLTPILLPGLQAVQKAFLQQAQTVTWNTSKAATESVGGGHAKGHFREGWEWQWEEPGRRQTHKAWCWVKPFQEELRNWPTPRSQGAVILENSCYKEYIPENCKNFT